VAAQPNTKTSKFRHIQLAYFDYTLLRHAMLVPQLLF
jgi:hypothetical protein